MTQALRPAPQACPACAVAPEAAAIAARAGEAQGARLLMSLPTIHCTACITTIEDALDRMPGIRSARVNLTLRRLSVDAEPQVTAQALIDRLARLGYEAHELDPGTLSMTETDRRGRDLLMRVGVSGFAMMNIMLLSVAVWSGAEGVTRDLFHLISAVIAIATNASNPAAVNPKASSSRSYHRPRAFIQSVPRSSRSGPRLRPTTRCQHAWGGRAGAWASAGST